VQRRIFPKWKELALKHIADADEWLSILASLMSPRQSYACRYHGAVLGALKPAVSHFAAVLNNKRENVVQGIVGMLMHWVGLMIGGEPRLRARIWITAVMFLIYLCLGLLGYIRSVSLGVDLVKNVAHLSDF